MGAALSMARRIAAASPSAVKAVTQTLRAQQVNYPPCIRLSELFCVFYGSVFTSLLEILCIFCLPGSGFYHQWWSYIVPLPPRVFANFDTCYDRCHTWPRNDECFNCRQSIHEVLGVLDNSLEFCSCQECQASREVFNVCRHRLKGTPCMVGRRTDYCPS